MQKTKKIAITIIFLIAALILTMLTTACTLGAEKPEKTVSNALDAIKKQDEKKMVKYITYEELMNFEDTESEESKEAFDNQEIMKLFFKNLDYKIKSTKTKDNEATVKTQITNIDMKTVMQQYLTEAFQIAFADAFTTDGTELSEEQINQKFEQILIDKMSAKDLQTITTEVEIKLQKKDNKWKIQLDDKLQDAITGGLLTSLSSFGEGTTQDTPNSKLSDINNYIIDEIWNKGFSDIESYIQSGTSSTGSSLDIDFTLSQLEKAYKKKTSYDQYVKELDGTEYENIKNIWNKLSAETDTLYDIIESKKPEKSDTSYSFDTGRFYQYMNAFSDEIYKLE